MIQRKNVWILFMLLASAFCLGGCTSPGVAQGSSIKLTPAISEAATPTPSKEEQTAPTETPVPTATSTPTPTPTATPTPSPTPTPIPAVPAAPVAVNTDSTTDTFLINRDYPLASNYVPNDLTVPNIAFSFSNQTHDKRKLRKVAADALEDLYNAALSEAGLTIYGVSGYRSYDRQYEIYGSNLITKGIRHTNLYSAAPGTSEHQTGLAIDVSCTSIGFKLINTFAETPEGIWLKDNCWRFGFILRYPLDKEAITGYAYEPWHIRYVGVPLAYYLYTNNLTLEEYYGSPSSHTLAELEDRPLIDTNTKRFYLLYAATMGSEVYYSSDGSILVSAKTGYPHLKQKVLGADGKPIKLNNRAIFIDPVYDANGHMVYDKAGEICYTKPYFDADGNLWLTPNGTPVFLQPLWNANGTLAYDAAGNLLYTEPVLLANGMEFIAADGTLLMKVPMRDELGELTYHPDGSVRFYEPLTMESTNELLIDAITGLPVFQNEYYLVPHTTRPYPNGFVPPVTATTPDPDITPTPGISPEPEDDFWNATPGTGTNVPDTSTENDSFWDTTPNPDSGTQVPDTSTEDDSFWDTAPDYNNTGGALG